MNEQQIAQEIQQAEKTIQEGYNALIRACAKLGKDTEADLYDMRELFEHYRITKIRKPKGNC